MVGTDKSKRVLVIEDDSAVRCLLELVLTSCGCSSTGVSTVKEAIAQLESNAPFDLVISDYELPDGNGLDILEMVPKRCPKARRILISSRLPDPTLEKKVAELGGETLAKPFYIGDIQRLVHREVRPGVQGQT